MSCRDLNSRNSDDDRVLKADDFTLQVGDAVTRALTEMQPPQGATVIIQHLTINVKIASINSARGGATVNVNMSENEAGAPDEREHKPVGLLAWFFRSSQN